METNDKYEKGDEKHINETKKFILKDKYGNEIVNMEAIQDNFIMNIIQFKIKADYTLQNTLNILLLKLFDNSNDIGMNDEDFFIGLEIIKRINKNNNKNSPVLKLFNFYPKGIFEDDYFTINHPDFKEFLKDIGSDDSIYKNKIIIVPLTISFLYSLFLIYNSKIYIMDFGLVNITDDIALNNQKNLNIIEEKITNFIISKKYNFFEIWNIIDKLKEGVDIDEDIKKNINKNDQDILFKLIDNYELARNKFLRVRIMKENPRLDPSIFQNSNLAENVKILNIYNIQGSQACGYFCWAAIYLLINNNYNIEYIISSSNNGIFQIKVAKILCDYFFKDDQVLFKINEDISSNDYRIYYYDNNKIGIKKNFDAFKIKLNDNNYQLLKPDYCIDINMIHNMLVDIGYNII